MTRARFVIGVVRKSRLDLPDLSSSNRLSVSRHKRPMCFTLGQLCAGIR